MSSVGTDGVHAPKPPGALLAAIRARGQTAPVAASRTPRASDATDPEGGGSGAGTLRAGPQSAVASSTPPPSRVAATNDSGDARDPQVSFTPPKLLFSAADLQHQRQKTLARVESKQLTALRATPAAATARGAAPASDSGGAGESNGAGAAPKLLFSAADLQRQRQKTLVRVGSKKPSSAVPHPPGPTVKPSQGLAAAAAAAAAARATARQLSAAEPSKTTPDTRGSATSTELSSAGLLPSFRSGGPVAYLSQPIKHQNFSAGPPPEPQTPSSSPGRPATIDPGKFWDGRVAEFSNARANMSIKTHQANAPADAEPPSHEKKLLKKSNLAASSRSRSASRSRESVGDSSATQCDNNSLQSKGAGSWTPVIGSCSISSQKRSGQDVTPTATTMTPTAAAIIAVTTTTTTLGTEPPTSALAANTTLDENGYRILNSPTAIRRAFRKLSCRFLDAPAGYETLC